MPTLIFDFHPSKKQKIVFQSPEHIIKTNKMDQVAPCLNQANHWWERGYYVAGYLSYEAAPGLNPHFKTHKPQANTPLLWLAVFKHFNPQQPHVPNKPFFVGSWHGKSNYEAYKEGLKRIKKEIALGNSYQVNYTIMMEAAFSGDAYSLYEQLRKKQQGNYSAYIETDELNILSLSPELFFHIDTNKYISMRPMKGTGPRGRNPHKDQLLKKKLYLSNKDRAENVMIVDLIRNDITPIAQDASVCVPELFTIETYPTLYQMTSSVKGKLNPNVGVLEIFKALFPCGSITGAPKISTMNIIHQTEKQARGVYCGAIGYFAPDGSATFNVPIRTLSIDKKKQKAHYGVGGGITSLSKARSEYSEIKTKTKVLDLNLSQCFSLFETILLEKGRYFLLDEHLTRLESSAKHFSFAIDKEKILRKLEKHAKECNTKKSHRLRLILSKEGFFDLSIQDFSPTKNQDYSAVLAKKPTPNSIWLRHKTTYRKAYSQSIGIHPKTNDVLLWNKKEELTEFTLGNLVLKIDGVKYTPTLNAGFLPGVFRAHLLAEKKLVEKVLYKDDLLKASAIWMINSLRRWTPVSMLLDE